MTYRIVEEYRPSSEKHNESPSSSPWDLEARQNQAGGLDEYGDDIRNYTRVQIITRPTDGLSAAIDSLGEGSTWSIETNSSGSSELTPYNPTGSNSEGSLGSIETNWSGCSGSECPTCSKVFRGTSCGTNLRRHMRNRHLIDSRPSRFKCPVKECPAIVSRPDYLKRHLRDVHGYNEHIHSYKTVIRRLH